MIAVALACLPILATGHVIARLAFVGYYAACVRYLIIAAAQHGALPEFRAAVLGFVLPITAVTLLVLLARHQVTAA